MSVTISREQWGNLLNALEDVRRQRHLVTYRALIERLELPVPAMQTLTLALEHLAALDVRAEQPMRSALVISQGASRLPRPGFFDCASSLGRFSGASDGVAAASWHASEVARVFEYNYPELS